MSDIPRPDGAGFDARPSTDRDELARLETLLPDREPQNGFAGLLSSAELGDGADRLKSAANWLGQRLGQGGRYEIVRQVGRGGMANVYLATDTNRNDCPVAIKAPLDHLLLLPGVRVRLQREFRAMIELEHPHICRVIDTGTHDQVPFVVMAYLSGGHLAERFLKHRVNESPRTIENLFAWLRPIATAIDFMHRRNYVHRDIKPQNIMFDAEGNPCLCDLGIVRAIGGEVENDGEMHLTRQHALLGTPGYIAPEVGGKRPIDGRADLYSLAAITYLYLTDETPFIGGTPLEIRDAQIKGALIPASDLNRLLPPRAADAIAGALAVDPAVRPATCVDFVDQLQCACGLMSASQISASIKVPWARRNVRRISVVLALTASGIAAWMLPPIVLPNLVHPIVVPDIPDGGEQKQETNPDRTAQIHYENALRYIADGEPDDALEALDSAVRRRPDDARLYAARGEALRLLDRYDESVQQYTEAIARNAEATARDAEAEYYFQRGRVHLVMPQHAQQAREDFAKAVSLDSRPAYNGYLGAACVVLRDYGAAIQAYTLAISRGGQAAGVDERAAWHNGRGMAALSQSPSLLPEAEADFTAAIRLQPSESKNFRNRAEVYSRMKERNKSAADLDEAVRLERQHRT